MALVSAADISEMVLAHLATALPTALGVSLGSGLLIQAEHEDPAEDDHDRVVAIADIGLSRAGGFAASAADKDICAVSLVLSCRVTAAVTAGTPYAAYALATAVADALRFTQLTKTGRVLRFDDISDDGVPATGARRERIRTVACIGQAAVTA
jgi:hypothetical protein